MGDVREIILDNKDYECITNDDAINYVVPKHIAKEIRADERRKLAEWFKKSNYYLCYSDTIDEVLAEYEKEQMKGEQA